MKTVCGIDLGTQSCKILVYDAEGRKVLASAQAPLDMISRDDGAREQEASWYADALAACFAAIDPGVRATIAALGVSGQQHGFVPLDEGGRPLHPVKLWCDTSTAAECAELTAAAGGEAVLLAETGMPMLPGYTASIRPNTATPRARPSSTSGAGVGRLSPAASSIRSLRGFCRRCGRPGRPRGG